VNIVVLDGYTLNPGDNPWTELEALGSLTVYPRTAQEQVLERVRQADIIFTNKAPVTREVIEAAPNLRAICVLATGYNVVDLSAARNRGIVVCNVPAYGADSVAQHTMALLLELCHHVGEHSAAVHAGQWTQAPDFCFWRTPLVELSGKVLGVIGFGRIGQRVAALGRAFGMQVWITTSKRPLVDLSGYELKDLEEIFAGADVVTLHCPLSAATERMVNERRLAAMKSSALLINTARGALVDEAALSRALEADRIAGAALDVVSIEPMHADNPLIGAKNCIITPHIGWATLSARKRLMAVSAENVRAILRGTPINVVS
jgi:glycerate dehydrogenase